MTRVHGQLKTCIHTTGSEAHRDMLLGYIPVIHMYLQSEQVHMVGGTDQGVDQLQQEFFHTLRPKSPLYTAIFPGYTVIKGLGWTQKGGAVFDKGGHPRVTYGLPWVVVSTMVSM